MLSGSQILQAMYSLRLVPGKAFHEYASPVYKRAIRPACACSGLGTPLKGLKEIRLSK